VHGWTPDKASNPASFQHWGDSAGAAAKAEHKRLSKQALLNPFLILLVTTWRGHMIHGTFPES
jgi:hypothetical protein